MGITKKDVDKIARLAKLELSEEERERYASQLDSIVAYVEKLSEVDTSGIEPLAHVNDLMNVWREDKSRSSLSEEEVFKNSPKHDKEFFLVPKVLKT
ncbi:MAG: Asp-tRNA(Asn)/Glu-tRNA(Gln) amidotransferase subunit GatC [Candidatus Marinimicrobia bacterium]|nr:Asp-tRNA(Asn)/Glu-tRNA(Gln) amidotransferase subunit GatC [Candidatus Neomarinimicrobiota bacterium]